MYYKQKQIQISQILCVHNQMFSMPDVLWFMDCRLPGSSVHGILQVRILKWIWFSSVQFCCSGMSDSLQPHGMWHARSPCPSATPWAYSNSCPLSRWWHPTISSPDILFSHRLQYFPASGSFQMNQFFPSGGQSIGVSASAGILQMNIQDWCPWGLAGWISLQSKGLSRAFINNTIQKYQFFCVQLSL